MKKNTMYLLSGVVLVGLAYYLYNKNSTDSFANASGDGGDCCVGKICPRGSLCQTWYTQTTPTTRMKHCGCRFEDMRNTK